ncbi:shugoshin 1-like isoform X1 [Lagopus muta]|uniref:shugoshin 1-like isoform X1 n=2 Tax=Lagopus muta TaxID=64668 RepID=UPI0020A19B3B|nr:shugoshin 1-like isoform X1 [Lagopus muta]
MRSYGLKSMACRKASEASFNLSDVRERMREKKNSVLRTAKLNASLASKIRTKIINNSSIIKVSLKHNNKALALALNAEKANAQRLAKEKVILQMELEQCHFQNAFLRNKLCFLSNVLKELENLVESVKMARLSEYHPSHLSLSNGQKTSMTEDSWADDISDGHLLSTAAMPLRVPISKPTDCRQSGSSTAVRKSSLDLQRCAPDKPLETLSVSEDALPPQLAGKLQSHQKENGKNRSERREAQEAFLDSCLFRESLCATQQNLNSLSALAWESCPLPYEDEMVKQFCDRLSQGHVTQRRKRSTWFATSAQSSGVDITPHVSSTRATWCGIVKDSSSFSESNTQPQLKSPSSLTLPTEATVSPNRRSSIKEAFCDQPQAEEPGCSTEVDSSSGEVMEFVPVKIKSKVNCKTDEKKAAKKASAGRKKTNMIKTSAKNGPDIPQSEENTQNAKKPISSEVAAWPSGSEASDLEQKACVGALDLKNRGSGVVQNSHSNNVRIRRTYLVNKPQLNSLESGDLVQVEKDGVVEIQSMESSLLKSPVHTVSSHEVPSDDCSLQNSFLLRGGTSSACALQEDSSNVTTKSIRQKTNRKTRVISQINDFEENLPSSMEKIPEARAEEQCKSSQIRRRKTIMKSSCQKNEGNFDPFIDVQGIAEDGTRDSLVKCRKRTYFVCPLDLTENLGSVQTDFEKDEMVPSKCIPGSKASKIPRVQMKGAAQNNKKQTGDPLEKEQTKVVNTGSLEEESNCKPKPRRKRKTSVPPKTSSVDKQSDDAGVLQESSTELVSKQTVLIEKSSCPTNLLSELGASLEERIADISLPNNLTDLSQSLESSSVICSTDLPVSCGLTGLPVSKNSETKGERTPEKSSLCPESSLLFKERRAEEASKEKNKVVSSFKSCSQSSSPQEPEIRPLQDLTNARTSSLVPCLEEVSERASRRRPDPACYREPSLKCKLRRGDPFTNKEFLHSPVYKTKKKRRPKTKELTKNIKEEQVPVGCSSANASKLTSMGDKKQEVMQ